MHPGFFKRIVWKPMNIFGVGFGLDIPEDNTAGIIPGFYLGQISKKVLRFVA